MHAYRVIVNGVEQAAIRAESQAAAHAIAKARHIKDGVASYQEGAILRSTPRFRLEVPEGPREQLAAAQAAVAVLAERLRPLTWLQRIGVLRALVG
jgi:hypothetical protein